MTITHYIGTPPSIEKVPEAARRMGISTCQVYREAKAGNISIFKIGKRSSGILSSAVDAWIKSKTEAAK